MCLAEAQNLDFRTIYFEQTVDLFWHNSKTNFKMITLICMQEATILTSFEKCKKFHHFLGPPT
jgi:hypothetical protein